MNSGFESRSVWGLPWILDSLQTILQFKAEIKIAAGGDYMGIPEWLPWQTYQGDSDSLNPLVLLPSCKYSCQRKVSVRLGHGHEFLVHLPLNQKTKTRSRLQEM